MECRSCGSANPGGHRFCQQCGAALARACPGCGEGCPGDARFCGRCGTRLDVPPEEPGPAGERRQITVLFADLAGYTSLTRELGDEATHELMTRFFALVDGVIERLGGAVDKHIGDCVMAVFGAPVAHGNDAERAVRAAHEIRHAVPELGDALQRPLAVHIGVASGQVVAAATGAGAFTVTGGSVNLAARLTDAAAPGEVLITEGVRAALGDRFDLAAPASLALKGLATPVRAFRVIGPRRAATPRERPFVGRRRELHHLEAALDACRDGGAGQALYLRGEAGIGKTRLVEELERLAVARGFSRHKSLVLDFGGGSRDAIRTLVGSLLGLPAGADPAARAAALERVLVDGWIAAERRVFLHDLLEVPPPVELRALLDAMGHRARGEGARATVAALVEAASRERPRLLVVEDLHWAERAVLDQLAALTAIVADLPALLLMTSRIEGDPLDAGWRAAIGGSPLTTLDLGPLRPEDARALTTATFPDLASDDARRCLERAGGNPLFLEQLLLHAEEGAGGAVPGTIQSLVQARMDRLGRADREALHAASVLGQRFSLPALGHLVGRDGCDLARPVAELLVRPLGEDYLFAHALVRDAIYDGLLGSRCRALHARAADWFEGRDAALRAEHLDRAGDARAALAYLEAARQQLAAYRYEAALALAARGRDLARDAGEVVTLTCLEGEILDALGRVTDSIAAYQRALEAAGDDAMRCPAWLGLAQGLRVADRLDEALALLARAEPAARAAGRSADLARIHHLRGNLYFPSGRIEACFAEHEAALAAAEACDAPELIAQALGGLGDAEYARGRMISSHRRFHACIELSRRHGLGRVEVANAGMVAHTSLYFAPQASAVAEGRRAAEAAARVGHRRAEINARLAVMFALWNLGDRDGLAAEIATNRALIERLGARRFEVPCLLYEGRIALAAGDRTGAAALWREGVELAWATGFGFYGAGLLGALALAAGDRGERRRLLAEAQDALHAGAVAHNHLHVYPDAIEASLEAGEVDEVERHAAALEAWTAAEPLPFTAFFIKRGRALALLRDRGALDDPLRARLEQLRAEGLRLGLHTALAAVERALAA